MVGVEFLKNSLFSLEEQRFNFPANTNAVPRPSSISAAPCFRARPSLTSVVRPSSQAPSAQQTPVCGASVPVKSLLCFSFHPPTSPLCHGRAASTLVIVLVLAAAVSPEVKQSAVIYQLLIGPIAEPGEPGPGLWRHSPPLIKFQSSAMMNVKELHPCPPTM